MMMLQGDASPRFVRRTQLSPGEYRKNFEQIDREVLVIITSSEADQITPLMSKIYLRLVNAPERFWEREGVLRIEAEVRDEKMVKAWTVLCELVGVASATASKAVQWMHEQGIIGYFSGKNGVGLRIFLNRAVSSIGVRTGQAGKKILAFPPASSDVAPASPNEPAFNDSFAVRENSDSSKNRSAPKSGADNFEVDKISSEPPAPAKVRIAEIVRQVVVELEPSLQAAARQAAAREQERTREWLETRGLPKAARVAQREAYNVLRSNGLINQSAQTAQRDAEVGRRHEAHDVEAKLLLPDEIRMMAEACVALLETQGQAIDVTLAEMSADAGGTILPEDAPKVRDAAHSILNQTAKEV